MLALEVLREEIPSYDRQLQVIRVDASAHAGETLAEAGFEGPDRIVVGVERDGEFTTDVTADDEIRESDRVLLVGSDEALDAVDS